MFRTTLRYGIQTATETKVERPRVAATVGQQIESLLDQSGDPQVARHIREALRNPQSTIEVKAGGRVQTATPDMPLRELLPPEGEEVQITVSQPHVGG
ncbi:MAG: hypothetical protein ABIL09_29685 [Gemmatimonadota bacterium]